jgi:hypothetical protein
MKISLEIIYNNFYRFKVNGKIKENDPRYSDIDGIIPKLKFVISRLKAMLGIYKFATLDPLQHPEKLSMQHEASILYEESLLECRGGMIEIYAYIKWWCRESPSANCQDLASAG